MWLLLDSSLNPHSRLKSGYTTRERKLRTLAKVWLGANSALLSPETILPPFKKKGTLNQMNIDCIWWGLLLTVVVAATF